MILSNPKVAVVCLFVLLTTNVFGQNSSGREMDEMWGDTNVSNYGDIKERSRLFDESNFGMFIHWGLYSKLAGQWDGKTWYGISEHILSKNMAGIPVEEYKKIAEKFNPSQFDAYKIASLAKNAGMKYIIITSKHCDGFAMYHSKADEFNIVDSTPYGRDPMKELVKACRELGLGFGFYYQHNSDWVTPGGTGGPATYPDGTPASFADYFYKKCLPQVKEICTYYGKLDFIWFDTPGNMEKKFIYQLANVVRTLQPTAMLCSRIGKGLGDYTTLGDMQIPVHNVDGLWETCDTNNDSWGYAWYDKNFKSPKVILERLISTVARGGTYLFNVGPDGQGQIPAIAKDFLLEVGQWIDKYPYVIYNSGSSPWGQALAWGDVTTQGNNLYLSVFEWPDDGRLYVPGVTDGVKAVKIIDDGIKQDIEWRLDKNWLVIDLPLKPADKLIPVVLLQVEDGFNNSVQKSTGIYPNVESELLTVFADVRNAERSSVRWMEKYGEWKHVDQVGDWKNENKAEWTVEVFKPGYYYLDLRYRGDERLVWRTVTDEGIIVQNQQPATRKYQDFRMGVLEFQTAGKHKIAVSLVEGNGVTASLESVKITPIE